MNGDFDVVTGPSAPKRIIVPAPAPKANPDRTPAADRPVQKTTDAPYFVRRP